MTNDNDPKDAVRDSSGPFVEPRVRARPWEASETEWGPFDRRRPGSDRRGAEDLIAEEDAPAADPADRRRRWGRRKADVLSATAEQSLTARSRRLVRRFREPLIGLTLAGVAAPLINAGVSAPGPTEASKAGAEAGGDSAAAAAATRDMEGEVGERWAEAEEDAVRSQTIEGAMTRYGIDRELAEQIYEAAERHGIEPDMAYGLVKTESTFRDEAVSHVGARGLTQLMPRTAQWLDPSISVRELFDSEKNLDLGFRYLRQLIEKYDGNVENALTAYNRGPGTVDRILDRGGNPDNGYAGKVLSG